MKIRKRDKKHRTLWMPSLENWDGGLKIFYGRPTLCVCVFVCVVCIYVHVWYMWNNGLEHLWLKGHSVYYI